MIEVGEKALITTNEWFYAPDGDQYRAVFGTVKALKNSEQVLGIKTNARSTNWYVEIGNTTVAGCQIHYAIRTDNVSKQGPSRESEHEGKVFESKKGKSNIYFADGE